MLTSNEIVPEMNLACRKLIETICHKWYSKKKCYVWYSYGGHLKYLLLVHFLQNISGFAYVYSYHRDVCSPKITLNVIWKVIWYLHMFSVKFVSDIGREKVLKYTIKHIRIFLGSEQISRLPTYFLLFIRVAWTHWYRWLTFFMKITQDPKSV